ncbi:ester cyclase [Streptomyces alkaliterrae]|uniref:Ester cyclase n=1 Tax=Streptomyces alkaliterrae TaxID=2213162 RepID=A0A5P0YQW0_9ACTN|nr:ester cyclase [Streptomyces alkaliterrae]MBB1254246.1 ester cyclase [Streptomyces alkaliterrae]MBB1260785.1 ester cyclase [Streptomyces alkaliterrae]MQS02638.1 ester cyclase [Streptomyces alkaliterrae]
MSFVQVIDCRTTNVDELNRLMDSWAEATKGKRTATHAILGKDRADTSHVVEIVEFPSYEEAMKNSHLPETDRIFREMVAVCETEPSFTDLDVVRDEQLNKELVRRYFDELVNGGNIDVMDELCTADYREHDPSLSSYDLGVEEAKRENREIMEAFRPRAVVESMVAEGDMVSVRFSFTGRHVGAYQGIEATDKEIKGTGHGTVRCAGGKIAESWWNTDDLGLMQQLGVVEA